MHSTWRNGLLEDMSPSFPNLRSLYSTYLAYGSVFRRIGVGLLRFSFPASRIYSRSKRSEWHSLPVAFGRHHLP